jgi:hypothetical protein
MRIIGEWLRCDDGTIRPTVHAQVIGAQGRSSSDRFLVDSGADRTVLSAALLSRLQLSVERPPSAVALMGIGGTTDFVLVTTALIVTRDDGGVARIRGEFAAFTDPEATDLSVLGRDVLDNFDVILSRRRDEVVFLAGNHHYRVAG